MPKTSRTKNKRAVGIDLGVKDQVTFFNGVNLAYSIPIPRRLKRLHHWFSRTEKGFKRRQKLVVKIKFEYKYEYNVKGMW